MEGPGLPFWQFVGGISETLLIIFIPSGVGDALVRVVVLMLDIALLVVFEFLCKWNAMMINLLKYETDLCLFLWCCSSLLSYWSKAQWMQCTSVRGYLWINCEAHQWCGSAWLCLPICYGNLYIKFHIINISWDKCYFLISLHPINYSKWMWLHTSFMIQYNW